MVRFSVALVCFISTVSSIEGLRESLNDVAKRESMRNPQLRKRDLESKEELERKLSSMAMPRSLANNNNNYNYNGGGNGNSYGNYYNANSDGADAYWWDQYMEEQGIGFDITNYAVKYTQCATVQTYSDELAENEYTDTVLAAQRFALFRLCPKDQCSSFSTNGCGHNYGEYLVSLDQFLVSMLEYQETRVAGYCQYCQKCAAVESAKAFWTAAYNNRDYALTVAQKSYNSWYTSYLETYYANSNSNANGNNGNNGYQQIDSNTAAQRYYQQVRNSGNYANQYAQNYYGNYQNSNSQYGNSYSNSYSSNQATQQYRWTNQDMWRIQNNQNMQSSNQQSWNSMGSPAGSFYGKTIVNGYYDEDGVFNQVFGYFNANGEYVSLEDEELSWDEGLWGEQPDLWSDVTMETESCAYKYAGSCYNQYESCMQILQDSDYQEYQQNQQNQQYQGQYQQNSDKKSTLKDFVTCVEVEPYMGQNGNQWAVNQYYQNGGGYSQNYAQQQEANCYDGDENCEKYNEYKQNVYKYESQQYANRRYFIGPHCGSNSRTISLAVYSDPYCSVLDETAAVNDVLGYEPNTDGIDLFPDECMSCLRDDTTVWYEDEEVYGLEPMCSMLYQFAGKCNKNLDATEYQQSSDNANANYNQYQNANQYQQAGEDGEEDEANQREQYENQYKQMYQSIAQAQNEESVCSFIESLSSNTYNENGEVTAFDSFSSGWKSALQAPKAMNAGVLAGLIVTAMLAVSMGIAACVLHGALARKNIPWKPRRSKGEDPTDLARQNSGITMGRSRSGAGANPLL